ncbi:MAG TPA: hypothetical protein VN848_12280 [Gemmatimonadales bacterium]|nr:hypothetical protein [Gemmatimonadales bacterium]
MTQLTFHGAWARLCTRIPRLVVVVGVLATGGTALGAQSPDTTATEGTVVDTTHHIAPGAAAWRSMIIPGWGQALTGRPITGALFVTWEGVTMMMTLRAVQEETYLNQSGSPNIVPKRQQVQDWVVLWVFNHLFSAAEAFVSAQLIDFPKDWKLVTLPRGIGLEVPVP